MGNQAAKVNGNRHHLLLANALKLDRQRGRYIANNSLRLRLVHGAVPGVWIIKKPLEGAVF
jgi:hypothetical protein